MLKKILDMLKPFSKRKRFSSFIQLLVGCQPRNIDLYKQAFIHKSSSDKQRGNCETNERLEYLGDAVLGAIVAGELFRLFPDRNEGFLTKTRSKIVNRSVLNSIGFKLGIEPYIVAQNSLSLEKTHVLGDALEALIGAVYVDRGFAAAHHFVVDMIMQNHIDIDAIAIADENYKSTLIEYCQRYKLAVGFETEEHPLSSHGSPEFIAVVLIDSELFGHGVGASKKEAQQMASKEALDKLRLKGK